MDYPDILDAAERSHERVQATLDGLTDAGAREPSLLPGWSRGHLATHLARSADAVWRFAAGVVTGTAGIMYPGGYDARAAAIEEGADRPAALLAADFAFADTRSLRVLREIPDDLLDTEVAWRRPIAARDLAVLRWRELEIHHVDLGLDYTIADWSDEFVATVLTMERDRLAVAAPDVAVPELPDRELLAWILGRPQSPGLPELPPWPF